MISNDLEKERPEENRSKNQVKTIKTFPIVKQAFQKANQYFIKATAWLSLSLIVCIAIFVSMWVKYIHVLGLEHPLTKLVSFIVVLSLQILVVFMLSLYLYNKTHTPKSAIKMWSFTKEVTWPWCWEGLKASVIMIIGFIILFIPGLIKMVHYTFFSFVVFFNRFYKEGKISALKHSAELSKGFFWWIAGFYIGYNAVSLLVFFVAEAAMEWSLSRSTWILYVVLGSYSYFEMLIFIYFFAVLYFIYAALDRDQMIGANT